MVGADAIARILAIEGTEFVVGFPENRIFDSAAGLGIRPIITRTERVAMNIADGFTRMSNGNRIAVACVQYGPGAESALGGIAQAFGDGTPILLLASEYERREQDIAPNFRAEPVYQHVTAWSTTLNDWDKIGEVFRRAFRILRGRQSGPVVIGIADDLLNATDGRGEVEYEATRATRTAPDSRDLERLMEGFLAAERPVVVAGHGVLYAEATSELREFAERANAPVMTTLNGKSAFPEDHPLALGAGAKSRPTAVDSFLRQADFILGIGTSFTRSEYITPMPPAVTIGQITTSERDVGKCYPVAFACVGDAKLALQEMLTIVQRGTKANQSDWGKAVEEERQAFLSDWMPRLTSADRPISPYRVVADLMSVVDRNRTVVTHDAGHPRDQIVPFYQSIVPRGYMGWGKTTQLGTGLGLMMGARLARPDWITVNVMGDAAFGMVAMDLETSVRERIPILTIVLNNGVMGGYAQYMPIATERFESNRLSGDYSQLARALGAHAERVDDPSGLTSALTRCLDRVESGETALLEVMTREEPVFAIPSGA